MPKAEMIDLTPLPDPLSAEAADSRASAAAGVGAATAGEAQPAGSAELQPGDWYMEDGYLVFTAQYHLRRGFCCNSGCRHCPYS